MVGAHDLEVVSPPTVITCPSTSTLTKCVIIDLQLQLLRLSKFNDCERKCNYFHSYDYFDYREPS